MPSLVVEKGHDKGKAIPVSPGSTTLLGRDSSTVHPLRDTMASRMHCKIEVRDGEFWLHDLESMNGTYLNGSKLKGEPIRLSFGDLIKVGETLFTFQSDESSATTLSGQRVGGYRIIERVGRGGMGTVYKAEQIDLQRHVALKVISEEHTKQKDFIDLFIHEARAAAKLNHPNIVQVYDVKRHSDLYYFSMEFVSGGSVQDILNKQRRIAVDESVRVVLDAARGLEYAHKKGIIHRDIKPDNLFFSETGMIKIGDMGLARGLGEKVGPEEETSVIGTPHYIAPEQVLGQEADFRSDMYSLGATMYRMLAGVTPHSAPSVRELVNKKVREDAASLQEHNADVPKGLAQIVAKMMARDPQRRYEDMTQVIAALEKFQRGHGEGGTEARREPSMTFEAIKGNKPLVASAAVVGVAAIVGLLALAFSGDDPPPPVVNPPVVGTNGNGYDPARASQMLENVKTDEGRRMNDKDVRSIKKIIDGYTKVIETFPRSPEAAEAEERRADLELMRRELLAKDRLKEVEAKDVANFAMIREALSGGSIVLTPAEDARREYKVFTQDPENRDTQSVLEASARAGHIERWMARVEEQRSRFRTVTDEVTQAREQGRYRKAFKLLQDFKAQAAKAALECDFAEDRYGSVLYEGLVDAPMKEIAEAAQAEWALQESEAKQLEASDNLDEAISLLEKVIAHSIKEVVDLATPLRNRFRFERDRKIRDARARAEREMRKKLEESRAAFATETRDIRQLVVGFDVKAAVAKMRELRDQNMDLNLKPILDRRTAELERVLNLKESLIGVINTPDTLGVNPHGFKREFTTQAGQMGMIESADETGFFVALDTGGTVNLQWNQMAGMDELYLFIKSHWKHNRDQRTRHAEEQCNLVALCLEMGLYEEAQEEIDVILTAMKDPQYIVTQSVRTFLHEYRDRLLNNRTSEYVEIEAEKRLLRLERFMGKATPEAYAAARAEIKLLNGKYGETEAVKAASAEIDAHLKSIPAGAEMGNRSKREASYRTLLKRVSKEQSLARKSLSEVVLRLARIDDPFRRNVHLGSAYAAMGEWRTSTEKYDEARRLGVQMLERKEGGPGFPQALGVVYAELLRNLVMVKARKNAELVRNEGSRLFVTSENVEEDWWVSLRTWVDTWSENVYQGELRRLPKLREELRENPDDPEKIWELGFAYAEGIQDLSEARGYLLYLMENHPDFPQVKNGNCLWRTAEILYAARDVRGASDLYLRLRREHREHPKVADEGARDSVKSRLEACARLQVEMGYRQRNRR